jgi:FKBP-type peptidyl-prolyl cis-trans isomerase (trigger factor)
MSHNHTYKVKVKLLPETGEIELSSSIDVKEFAEAIKETVAHIQKDLALPGFRKGAAPEKLVREKVGEVAILKEAAEHAISHAYSHIIEAEKIDAIGHPKVSITKLAEGNPLEFTLVTAVVPEVKKFDYVSIAKKENSKKPEPVAVSDAEVDKAIEDIKNNFSRINKNKDDKGAEAKPLELTDDLVKTWGEFKDVADFKAKLRENLTKEKEHKALEKKRIELVDALTQELNTVIPEVLIQSELARMVDQMKHDVERMGLKWDDYLKHLKKSEDDIKKEWRNDAVKRVKLDLILDHIAKEEKIEADKAKVEAELKHALDHHKGVSEDRARSYFAHIFQNQAVFEFLEKQK